MKFRKKPVVIEAVQWQNNIDEIKEFTSVNVSRGKADTLMIPTLEGLMMASLGDWIIKGIQGEIYPCKPNIFEATYDKVMMEH